MALTVATWNVNSIRARIDHVAAWTRANAPDVLLLQELKCTEESMPRQPFEDLGYGIAMAGQKSLNGVALLARHPIEDLRVGLPGDDDDGQARYVEATVKGLRVASIYLPNGNPPDSEKFPYKLAWLARLHRHIEHLLEAEAPAVLGGDYNVIPEPIDCHDPAAWEGDALYRPESRRAFRALLHLGLTDAVRALHGDPGLYSFWDYQGRAWAQDHGIRIDHVLLAPQTADRLQAARIDRDERARLRASDHVPVVVTLAEA